MTTKITIARGDGIGPEIMDATLRVLEAAGADLSYDEISIGKAVYESGQLNGISPESWDSLHKTRLFLKAPITTPQGGGFKSLNVTIRKSLGLFANVRPVISYAPYVETRHPNMDLVIVRENEEDLYGGIEYRHSADVIEAMKLISRPGCERIVRYAFEYARSNGRRKVTCMTKDNIMKMSDGLFHKVYDEIGAEYPEIEQEHYIIDIGTARLANVPHQFDVIVLPNLYGDILSDVAAEISGSVGLAGSSNIGSDFAMFEAIHGSAPDIAGKGIANPSGLMNGAIMMLVHIGQCEQAAKIHNAWLRTLEEGYHIADIYQDGKSRQKVGTADFAKAVIDHLGEVPKRLRIADYSHAGDAPQVSYCPTPPPAPKKELVGCDVFLDWKGDPEKLGAEVTALTSTALSLNGISNRGVAVWPNGQSETFCSNHWRLRFRGDGVTHNDLYEQASKLSASGYDVVKLEALYSYDGQLGFSASQGE